MRYLRIRRQQIIREAEGYLDLAMVLSDQWPLGRDSSDRLARRALASLKTLPESDADSAEVLFLRGQALRVLEQYADAIEPLREAALREETNIHIALALAWCFKRLGRLDLAIEAIEEVLPFDTGEPILHYNLACYWSLAGNLTLALKYLAQALDIDPNLRELVGEESDFDAIRTDPQFLALTSVVV